MDSTAPITTGTQSPPQCSESILLWNLDFFHADSIKSMLQSLNHYISTANLCVKYCQVDSTLPSKLIQTLLIKQYACWQAPFHRLLYFTIQVVSWKYVYHNHIIPAVNQATSLHLVYISSFALTIAIILFLLLPPFFVPEISRPLERKTPWNFIESKSKTLERDIPPCFWWIPKQVCLQGTSSGLSTVKYLNLLKLNCCIFLLCIWGGVKSVSFGY